jgi:hypothetical protein
MASSLPTVPSPHCTFGDRAERVVGVMARDGLDSTLRESCPHNTARQGSLSRESTGAWYVYREGSRIPCASN